MLSLAQGIVGRPYKVAGFHPSLMQDSHLRDLGLVIGSTLRLISNQKDGGIITCHHTKMALNQEILEKILVTEDMEAPKLPLSQFSIGQKGVVANVLGAGAIKRRLLDMGITKGTEVVLRKMAPLGDPLEIRIRGYELTLRKEEAELVMVYIEEDDK